MARLALKELRETLRDRRTVLTLVLMPVLVYPLLSIAFQRFLLTWRPPAEDVAYHVAVESNAVKGLLQQYLIEGESITQRSREWRLRQQAAERERSQAGEQGRAPAPPSVEPERAQLEFFVHDDLEARVADRTVDVGVRIENESGENGGPVRFELVYAPEAPGSKEAFELVHSRLEAINGRFVRAQLRAIGITRRDYPLQTDAVVVELGERAAPFSLGVLVPLILILLTIAGAVYPAIDLTAGERERGTLEALIAAPVPRMGLLLAKYVAVLTVALLTAAINLAAMAVTIYSIGLDELLFGEAGLSPVVVAQVFGLLILFAALFSAAMLALTSFARSFKEAQAYLIPLMLVSMAPGMLSLIPDLELGWALAVTPLANIVLLARDLFQREADAAIAAVVVGSTALYSLAALGVAAKLFGSDAILYGSQGSWSDLLRRPEQSRIAPTVTSALLCLAVLFPAYVLLTRLLAQVGELPIGTRLGVNGLVTIAVFGGFPLAAAWMSGTSVVEGFRLKRFTAPALLGAILLGLSLWTFAFELLIWAEEKKLIELDIESERIRSLVEGLRNVSPGWLLLTMAVIPAVFEEFFFRGFLLTGLRTRLPDWQAIVISGVVFGSFHLIAEGVEPIRVVPSTLLGFVLGWVFCRTGSLFPGIVLHVCHNGFLLLMHHQQERVESLVGRIGWNMDARHLPASVLVAAALMAIGGAALIAWNGRREQGPSQSMPSQT